MTITVILNVILTVQHFRFSKVSRGSRMTLSMHGHLKEAQESRQRERNEHFFVKIKMNFVIVVDACYCCWCWRRTFEFIPCRSTSPVHSPRAHGPKALFGAFRSSCWEKNKNHQYFFRIWQVISGELSMASDPWLWSPTKMLFVLFKMTLKSIHTELLQKRKQCHNSAY